MNDHPRSRDLIPAGADSEPSTYQPYYDKSWAVVIGIDDYGGRHPRLANAVNDARDVADLFCDVYGFDETIALYDDQATHDTILTMLRDDLPSSVGTNDRLIFFFAGHGTTRQSEQGERRGYLIPQDARTGRFADYVDMRELRDACGWIPAKHILIVLDCCFSGVAAVASRGDVTPPKALSDVYLQRITERPAWQILTAGASDERAADSGVRPGHSAFTGALLAGLEGAADQNEDNLITASELAAYVKPQVTRETAVGGASGQTPFFNYLEGSEEGDFVFLLPGQMPKVQRANALDRYVQPALQRYPWLWAASAALLVVVVLLSATLIWALVEKERWKSAYSVAVLAAPAAPTIAAETTESAGTRVPLLVRPTVTLAARPSAVIAMTGKGVSVAILATGVDMSHPDLADRVVASKDFTGEGIQDENGFGTNIAGLVVGTGAASKGEYVGLAPNADLIIAKVLPKGGAGQRKDILSGLEWASKQGADVILLPFGTSERCDGTDDISQAADRAVERGAVVVVPVDLGGPGDSTVGSPGCARQVITVGFTGKDGSVADASGRGPTLDGRTKPDVVAPGEGIVTLRASNTTGSMQLDRYYTEITGSGPAAAQVASLAALVLEARPDLSPERVKQVISKTADDLGEDANAQGAGLIDVNAALQAVSRRR